MEFNSAFKGLNSTFMHEKTGKSEWIFTKKLHSLFQVNFGHP